MEKSPVNGGFPASNAGIRVSYAPVSHSSRHPFLTRERTKQSRDSKRGA